MFICKYRFKQILILSILAIATVSGIKVMGQSSANYRIESDVLDVAGAPSTSVNYELEDATGQPLGVGLSISSHFELRSGFLTPWTTISTSVESLPRPVESFALGQNYPNPFNLETGVPYSIPQRTHVVIRIMDILGNEIITLVNENQGQGFYVVKWRGTNHYGKHVANGIYLYQIKAGAFSQVRKMNLIR